MFTKLVEHIAKIELEHGIELVAHDCFSIAIRRGVVVFLILEFDGGLERLFGGSLALAGDSGYVVIAEPLIGRGPEVFSGDWGTSSLENCPSTHK